jgi:hypothetical protein
MREASGLLKWWFVGRDWRKGRETLKRDPHKHEHRPLNFSTTIATRTNSSTKINCRGLKYHHSDILLMRKQSEVQWGAGQDPEQT